MESRSVTERYRGLLICAAIIVAVTVAVVLLTWHAGHIPGNLLDSSIDITEEERIRVVPIAENLEKPWGMAFLPDGDILITELPGRLRLVHGGKLQPQGIEGVPKVETRDQAGLMDIALDPHFAENRFIYFTYSKRGPRGNTPALMRAYYDGQRLNNAQDVFVSDAWSGTSGGNTGSRIVFERDGTILMSIGDRHEKSPAQDLKTDKGKIVRLNSDGTVPQDNPFVNLPGVRPEIFTYGVRNPEGLYVESDSGTVWESEFGPLGGDEINILLPGHNYGWPVITYGKNYDGSIISNETAHEGMDQPVIHWNPSISPSGITIYTGDRFPKWRDNLFVSALSGIQLRRVVFRGHTPVHEEKLLSHLQHRIRDVRQSPDGFLYILIDEPGALLKAVPVEHS
jgi:glucose/arabinose dehydrogenase